MPFPISPDEIERAYAETGLEPDGCWFDEIDHCANPLGVVLIWRHGLDRFLARKLDMIACDLGITEDQEIGFLRGFDGDHPDAVADVESYEAGRVARARCTRFIPPEEG